MDLKGMKAVGLGKHTFNSLDVKLKEIRLYVVAPK
jgi:hypothetical protein